MAKLTREEKKQLKLEKKQEKLKAKIQKKSEKAAKKKGGSGSNKADDSVTLNLNLSEAKTEMLDFLSSDRYTVRSLCAPDGVNPCPLGYLELSDGGKTFYVCCMTIDKLGRKSAFAETYAPLLNFPNSVGKVKINPMTTQEASNLLDKRVRAIESEIIAAEKDGDTNRIRKLKIKLAECEKWAVDVESGANVLFYVGFLFCIFSTSIEELNDACDAFYSLAKEKGIDVAATYSMHPEAYLSAAPLDDMMSVGFGPFKDTIIKYHPMDRYGLSTLFNHTQSNFTHKSGILAGRILDTGKPVLLDLHDKSHDNYNFIGSGISGVGKSATFKMWISRWMEIFGYRLAVIDMDSPNKHEGEYVPLVRAHNGVVYQIKNNSDNILNPFELDEEFDWNEKLQREERKLYLSSKVDDSVAIILSMITSGSSNIDFETLTFLKEVLSSSIMEMYTELGIEEGEPDSLYETSSQLIDGRLSAGKVKKQMPTLTKLYKKLLKGQKFNKSDFHDKAYALALSGLSTFVNDIIYTEDSLMDVDIDTYRELPVDKDGFKYIEINGNTEFVRRVKGSKPYFDGQSTFEYDYNNSQSLDIDISQLPEKDRDLGQQVAATFITEKVIKKKSCNPHKLTRLIVLIDEFHRMFNGSALDIVESLYRQARKRYVTMGTLTQSISDYNKNEQTRAIFKNSSMKFVFKQDKLDVGFIKEATPLTDAQINRLPQLGGAVGFNGEVDDSRKGELCVIDNNKRVAFMKVDYLVSSEAYICETDPAKIARMNAKLKVS